jgi:tetratricopeptide (TPR) repeat protein
MAMLNSINSLLDSIDSVFADAQKRTSAVVLALVALTLISYYPLRENGFVNYDDQTYVYMNPRVQEGLNAGNVAWAFQTMYIANWHPVTWLSHMADCEFFGLQPAGHHATSFLLHLINVLLLFWLLRSMTGATWRSAFVAAVFAVHPLNVESVAWVSERKNVLSTFFWLLTIWAYVRYVRLPGWRNYLLTAVFLALGLMTKPMLVTLPVVLLLLDFWPLRRVSVTGAASTAAADAAEGEAEKDGRASANSAGFWPTLFKLALEKVPLLALSAASSWVTLKAQAASGALVTVEGLTIKNRLTNTVASYAAYLYKMAWPTKLAPFYPHPGSLLPYRQVVLAALVLAAVTALVAWRGKFSVYLAVGWLWYLVTFVPVIGLVQVGGQSMADRYAYVPMLGALVAVAWGVSELTRRWPYRKLVLGGAAACVLLALALTTRQQVRHWKDSAALWAHTLAVTERNYVAYTNLAAEQVYRGQYDEAIENCNMALQYDPADGMTYETLGEALTKKGRPEEGIPHLYKSLRLTTQKETAMAAQRTLGEAMLQTGNEQKAIHHFLQTLRLDPLQAEPHTRLGELLYKRGEFDQALDHFAKAAQLKPDVPNYTRLASALQEQGKLQQAARFYRRALDIDPDSPETRRNLETVLKRMEPGGPTD